MPTTTGEDPSTSGMPMTTAMTTMADATTAGSSEGEVDTGPTVYFDLGIIPEAPMSEGPCGKVDFLFVIDNSGSMYEEQVNLVNSFPGFIAAIQGTLDTVEEYNLGVVTTDAYSYNNAVPGCSVLGGLVTKTGGGQSSNMVCGPYDAGNNYMTEIDDLAVSFACAAQVGTSGNGYELTMQAMLDAVDPSLPLAMAGGCNEGFIREDALLVLVIITDEYDGVGDPEGMTSAGTPGDWYDAVVAAKGGIPENVVVVSLVNAVGGPCPPGSTVYDGVNIVDFTNMFGANGLVGGVCELDYSPVFTQAVSVIDVACDNFMPPN
ncbi:hypothetical protein [Paraliomyxa miuraensis]|uniref:hypothetical protein n=1 Tax=Paraliomyxa miuraensis TaxID=376150 RepID=UPI00224FC4B6|nr:hypothetical protein [Paraliomyxa miuraensis]